MKQRIFAVMGATGHIGHTVVDDLIKRGHIVRAIGRNEEKLEHLAKIGAETLSLDFEDASSLKNAFKDCYAVFTMIPPATGQEQYGEYQEAIGEVIWEAITKSKVKRVVNLSSIGADLSSGTGPIRGLHLLENKLNTIDGLDLLIHLRPGFFMENIESFLPQIKSRGIIMSPIDEYLPIAMIATRDIGWKAADFLDSTAPLGHMVFEFIGPKNVTMQHVVEVLSEIFDHPELQYQQISLDEARKGMLVSAMPEETVDMMIEMYEGFNSGLIAPTEDLSDTHRGITSFEEYAQMLAHKHFSLVR